MWPKGTDILHCYQSILSLVGTNELTLTDSTLHSKSVPTWSDPDREDYAYNHNTHNNNTQCPLFVVKSKQSRKQSTSVLLQLCLGCKMVQTNNVCYIAPKWSFSFLLPRLFMRTKYFTLVKCVQMCDIWCRHKRKKRKEKERWLLHLARTMRLIYFLNLFTNHLINGRVPLPINRF